MHREGGEDSDEAGGAGSADAVGGSTGRGRAERQDGRGETLAERSDDAAGEGRGGHVAALVEREIIFSNVKPSKNNIDELSPRETSKKERERERESVSL